MKNPKIKVTNNIPAYKFRLKHYNDERYKKRLRKVSNRDLMYALNFHHRVN